MASFSFINTTPENLNPDEATRRTIRSQAMKDFRRRKLLEQRKRPNPSRTKSTEGHNGAVQRVRRRSSRQRETLSVSPSSQWQAHSVSRPQDRGASSVNASRGATTESVEVVSVNLLNNPTQTSRLFEICDEFHEWLLGSQYAPGPVHYSRNLEEPSAGTLLLAISLLAIGHLEAIKMRPMGVDTRLLKTNVLTLVNQRLAHNVRSLDDDTIGALACLASFEISRGCTEAKLHLRGMDQVLQLRDSQAAWSPPGLLKLLHILDLCHSIYFGRRAIYTTSSSTTTYSTPSPPPALPDTDEAFEELANLFLDLQDLTELQLSDDVALSSSSDSDLVALPASHDDAVQQWYDHLIADANILTFEGRDHLSTACNLAADIHLASTSPIKPDRERLRTLLQALFNAMTGRTDEEWYGRTHIHLRLLLTGLAAAKTVQHKSWYHAHLTRLLYCLDTDTWQETKTLIIRFGEMYNAARRYRPQAMTETIGGIEIVIDADDP